MQLSLHNALRERVENVRVAFHHNHVVHRRVVKGGITVAVLGGLTAHLVGFANVQLAANIVASILWIWLDP